MKFNFTKIVLPIDLGAYHESYAGRFLQVWVNPPREKKRERERLIAEYSRVLGRMMTPALTPVIGLDTGRDTGRDDPAPTRPSKKLIQRILEAFRRPFTGTEQSEIDVINQKIFVWLAEMWSQHENIESHWSVSEIQTVYDADPTLYAWLTRQTIELMSEFRTGQKKV